MVNVNNNVEMHVDHVEWNNELSFYHDSISTFENRLAEVSIDVENIEINKKIEHFQNQFIIQRNAVDKLKNFIQKHEINMTVNKKQNSTATSTDEEINYHSNLSEKMESHRKLFNELKNEFYNFVTQVS